MCGSKLPRNEPLVLLRCRVPPFLGCLAAGEAPGALEFDAGAEELEGLEGLELQPTASEAVSTAPPEAAPISARRRVSRDR